MALVMVTSRQPVSLVRLALLALLVEQEQTQGASVVEEEKKHRLLSSLRVKLPKHAAQYHHLSKGVS